MSESEKELVPLGFVDRWVTRSLNDCLAEVDKVPLKVEHHEHWKKVREKIVNSLEMVKELKHLASWLDVGEKPKQLKRRKTKPRLKVGRLFQ